MASKLNVDELQSSTSKLTVTGNITLDVSETTSYIKIPSGKISARPGSPVEGAFRYNESYGHYEVYTQYGWRYINLEKDYNRVVHNGCVLNLDAGNPNSWSGGLNTRWTDTSGYNNHAEMQNDPTWEPQSGGCFYFDGSNDWFDIPDFNLMNISMELVIKQNINNNKSLEVFGTHTICSSFPQSGFAYFPTGSGLFFYRFINGSGDRPHVRIGTTGNTINLTDGNWHHLTGTYDIQTNTVTFYHNGSFVSSSSSQVNSSSFQGNIGGNATSYAFNGRIAIARIYNKVLTADEVAQNYNATKARFGLS